MTEIKEPHVAPEIVPMLPRLDEIDPSRVLVRYDDHGDILHVHFSGTPQPAVMVDVNECLYLRVDIETNHVVGLMVEGYLQYAVQRDPALLALAELAGIEPAVIEAARKTITIDRKRESILRTIIHDVELAIA